MVRSLPRKCSRRSSRRTREAADRLVGIGEDLTPHEEPLLEPPDPGDWHIADAELAIADEDAAEDEKSIVAPLHPARRDQKLFPEPFDVLEVGAKAVRSDVGRAATHLLGGDREELHARRAEPDEFGDI